MFGCVGLCRRTVLACVFVCRIVCGHSHRGGIQYIYLRLGCGSVCFECMGADNDCLVFVGACIYAQFSGPLGQAAQVTEKESPASLPPTWPSQPCHL